MPGPYAEIYLQRVTLAETGNNNLDDQLNANFVWAGTRDKLADLLTLEWNSSSNPITQVQNSFTTIMDKSYPMTQISIPDGGDKNTSYTIYSVGYKKDQNGDEQQEVIDKVIISRPTNNSIGILSDESYARQIDLAKFELFLRVQATSITSDNLQLQFWVFNNQTMQWQQLQAGVVISVGQDSTVIYTLVTNLNINPYMANGKVQMQAVLFNKSQNKVQGTFTEYVGYTPLVVNPAPGNQNGSMPFQNGTIGFIDFNGQFCLRLDAARESDRLRPMERLANGPGQPGLAGVVEQ